MTVDEIRRLNHLDGTDKIYAGKWITIPRTGQTVEKPVVASRKPALVAASIQPAGEAVAAQKPAPAAPAAAPSNTYVVSAGDTFYGISKKFGVTYQSIVSANGIDSPQGLRTGMTLKIPEN